MMVNESRKILASFDKKEEAEKFAQGKEGVLVEEENGLYTVLGPATPFDNEAARRKIRRFLNTDNFYM